MSVEYLYTERQLGEPASGIVLTRENILTFHHSTLRLYDHSFSLLQEKYFYERILDIKDFGEEEEVVILFEGGKVVQLRYDLTPVCYRVVEGAKFICVRNKIAICYDTQLLVYFRKDEEKIHRIDLREVGIFGIEKCTLLESYIPTAIIAWRKNEKSRCSMLSLINKVVIEDFGIIENVLEVISGEKVVGFIFADHIEIRYQRDNHLLEFHPGLDTPLGIPLSGVFKIDSRIEGGLMRFSPGRREREDDGSTEIPCIVSFENPKGFFCDDYLVIVNGDGKVYKIKYPRGPEWEVYAEEIGKVSEPTSIGYMMPYLAVGSVSECPALYSWSLNEGISELSRCFSVGDITSVCRRPGGDFYITTTKSLYHTTSRLSFDILDKASISVKAERIEIVEDRVVVYGSNNTCKSYSVEKLSEASRADATYTTGSLDCNKSSVRLKGDILEIRGGEVCIRNVSVFSVEGDTLGYISGRMLRICHLPTLKTLFCTFSLDTFEEYIKNDEFMHSESLKEIISENLLVGGKEKLSEEISEILIQQNSYTALLIRTKTQLYLYKLVNGVLIKQFLRRRLTFTSHARALWNLGSFVYIRSKTPYCAFLSRGVYLHECSMNMHNPVPYKNCVFFVYRETIVKARLKDCDTALFDAEQIIKEIKTSFGGPAPQPSKLPQKLVVHRVPFDLPMYPTRILFLPDSVIMSTSGVTSFFYTPFVPMVHLACGPDSKPVSEPINKDLEVNTKPLILGKTLCHRISIYSPLFEYVSDVLLQEHEFLCDMKFLFNEFLVVCTSFCEGEDKFAKGRILVYLPVDLVFDPLNPVARKKLRLMAEEQMRSPCLACAEVCGLLAVCMGTRLMIYELDVNTGLTAVGRAEVSTLTTNIFVVDNYIVLSDIHQGLFFFFLRPRDPLYIHLLGRTGPIRGGVWSTLCIIHPKTRDTHALAILSLNSCGSISIYSYSPSYPRSSGGKILIRVCEINTKVASSVSSATLLDESTALFVSSSVLMTLKPIFSSRIRFFSEYIAYLIDNSCGINPKNYLNPTYHINLECSSCVSYNILLEFFFMSPSIQAKILDMAGMTYQEFVDLYDQIFPS